MKWNLVEQQWDLTKAFDMISRAAVHETLAK